MITCKEAREYVARHNNIMKEYKIFEDEVAKIIEKSALKGEVRVNIVVESDKIRDNFIDEMIQLGFECYVVNIQNIKTLVIKWG